MCPNGNRTMSDNFQFINLIGISENDNIQKAFDRLTAYNAKRTSKREAPQTRDAKGGHKIGHTRTTREK